MKFWHEFLGSCGSHSTLPEDDELEDETDVLGTSGASSIPLGRHRPEELTTLAANTRFTRKEIQLIYRGFKQECPTGLVDEEGFKQIFVQFFPQGDASQYAHYVFNTIKRKQSGKISFEVRQNFLKCH
ncbi:Similar to Kcnip1: Kv channel-interacting protein 1 (Mus musculus) [Cotesia congregata]|uniref:Similar to Kcnip1: Kv channel-interacting protein 1 (Mus musculus) n=1 Tax=Cotesia congregata TaxID=51543 RepID=A0A8J2ENA1_COTCN|nr:Similar to Kcnip1: Kv channel-interacting protein 1 (Mus musculus) [Cotesia congregata]